MIGIDNPTGMALNETGVGMNRYDLVFMGHVTIDEIDAAEGAARGVPGGAPFFGAFAASWSKKKIAVITRMAQEDAAIRIFQSTWISRA